MSKKDFSEMRLVLRTNNDSVIQKPIIWIQTLGNEFKEEVT